MKTKKVKEVYQCEHCGKWFLLKWRAINHEKKCNKNPVNKIDCLKCTHFEMGEDKKWYCLKDGANLTRVAKYDNQKRVSTQYNKCEDLDVL